HGIRTDLVTGVTSCALPIYAWNRSGQRDDRLFPARHVPMPAGDRRTKQRDEKHAEIAITENLHRQPVPALVEEQQRNQPKIKLQIGRATCREREKKEVGEEE